MRNYLDGSIVIMVEVSIATAAGLAAALAPIATIFSTAEESLS